MAFEAGCREMWKLMKRNQVVILPSHNLPPTIILWRQRRPAMSRSLAYWSACFVSFRFRLHCTDIALEASGFVSLIARWEWGCQGSWKQTSWKERTLWLHLWLWISNSLGVLFKSTKFVSGAKLCVCKKSCTNYRVSCRNEGKTLWFFFFFSHFS